MGTTYLPMPGSRSRLRSRRREGHGRRDRLAARAEREFGEGLRQRSGKPRDAPPADDAVGQVAAERPAARDEVLVHGRADRRAVVGRLFGVEGLVGDLVLQAEPVAQHPELFLGHLLDLVGGVARLDLGPERPALDGLGEDRRRRADLLGRRLVGGVELAVVVTAAGQASAARRRRGARRACAGGGPARRSARGCRRPTRWRGSGSRRRGSCSSC